MHPKKCMLNAWLSDTNLVGATEFMIASQNLDGGMQVQIGSGNLTTPLILEIVNNLDIISTHKLMNQRTKCVDRRRRHNQVRFLIDKSEPKHLEHL